MEVVFFHRKPRPNKNFSVEILFEQIRHHLPSDVQSKVHIAKYYSSGFLKRIYIALEAIFNQEEINHVTGDINFVAILLKKRRTVLTFLDVGLMNHPNPLARKVLQWFWIQLPAKRAAYITTISASTKNELLKYVKIDKKKIKVIYVPVSGDLHFNPKKFNENCPVILQIGTKENKNVNRLVTALTGLSCKLEIVGELNESQIEHLKVNKISYTNSINLSSQELASKYKEADIVTLVSTYEGFGMPIVEAQIVGRPVVTSDLLSMPEVAGDGALLVDPFDPVDIREAILKIIHNEGLRADLIRKGRENADRFSADRVANQYYELYKSMIN